MKWSLMLIAVSTLVLGMVGCDALRDYPKKIQEFPESWQTLDPGKPMENPPRIEVEKQGGGALIEPGDLVQLRVIDWSPRREEWREMDDWWLWVGFRPAKETAFFSYSPEIASALVGKQQGTSLKIIDGVEEKKLVGGALISERTGQLKLKRNPFGDPDYYSWKKNTRDSMTLSVPSDSGYFSLVEIKRVCKGQTKYRTVRLFDDSPVRTGSGFNTKVTRDTRELWIDEAKIEATCQDGRKAVFRYGPTGSKSGGKPRFVVTGYFDDWLYEAWKKLDVGVQFEGNRPPEAKKDMFETQADKAIRIDMLSNDRDTEGDKLSARITVIPGHGKLVANGDGAWTYTPAPGWAGTDFVRYRASDGLVESAETFVEIRVVKR